MTKPTELDKALVTVINDWYSSWHRWAEEDEKPPKHIKTLYKQVLKVGLGNKLMIETGLFDR